MVVSSLLCLPEVAVAGEGEASGGDSPSSPGEVASVLPLPGAGGTTDGRVEACRGALGAVKAFGLERCWEVPPLLDGGKVMRAPEGRAAGEGGDGSRREMAVGAPRGNGGGVCR